MALIQQIRNRSGLIIGIIGVAMVSFILMDALSSQSFLLSGNSTDVGEIDGNDIAYQEFNRLLQDVTENYKINSGKKNIDQETQDLLIDQTWNQLVFETIMNKEYADLGIEVSNEELFDLVQGSDPHPLVVQAFTNPKTGEFDHSQIISFLKNMDFDPAGESKAKWLQLEENIYSSRKSEKYNNMIKQGMNFTSHELKKNYLDQNKKATIEYVFLNQNTIPDTAVSISESELQEYYDKHKKKYKQENTRTIEYVVYDIFPSARDTMEILNWSKNILNEMKTTESDSLFVNLNSDKPFENKFHKKSALPAVIDTLMFTADSGFIYGPYLEDGAYKISRLVNKRMVPDSVNARHILLKPTAEKGLKPTLEFADTLKLQVEAGKDFGELARTYSEDPGTKEKGGDLGWFTEGNMVKPFNDAVFYYGYKGDMAVITSQFGVHLIQIIDTKGDSLGVQVATVERKIESSSTTEDQIFRNANEFLGKCKDSESFDNAILEAKLTKRLAENIKETDRTIIGLKNPKEIIRWAFKVEKGAVTKKVFELDDKFVITHLKNVNDDEFTPLSDVKIQIEVEVRNEKKTELLVNKIQDAMSGITNINELSKKLETEVQNAENITFTNAFVMGIGRDLNLSGSIFASAQGVLSKPVKGDNGAAVFTVKSFTEVSDADDLSDFKKQQLYRTIQGVDYEVFEALKLISNIKDNRAKFY